MFRIPNNESPQQRSLELVTGPASDPVTLNEIKNALRIDTSVTADDTLLTDCIKAATSILEKTFGLVLIQQTWKLWLDRWPTQKDWMSPYSSYQTAAFSLSEIKAMSSHIELGVHPVSSITHLKAYGVDGPETVDSGSYYLDTSHKPSRLVLKETFSWPSIELRPAKGIEVQFVAGFTSLPAELKMGVLSYAMSLYQARGCSSAIPAGVHSTFLPWAAARL
jgi:hypothetical protein